MQTNLAVDAAPGQAALELSADKKWCPRCATFQAAGNLACENCGAKMKVAPRPHSWRAMCLFGLIALFFSAVSIATDHPVTSFWLLIIGVVSVFCALARRKQEGPPATADPAEHLVFEHQNRLARELRDRRREVWTYGPINSHLVCPHCQTQGNVHTKQEEIKVGVSGGKATAAVLTGGLTLLAVGLSRKQQITAAWCGHCQSSWRF